MASREEDLIDQVSIAYFRFVDPLPEMSRVVELWLNQGRLIFNTTPGSPERHAESIFKVAVLFTVSLAVEGGRLENVRYWNPAVVSLFDNLCNTMSWKDQLCLSIQSPNYAKWTHAILFLIMQLRAGKWIDGRPLDATASSSFVDKTCVYLHAVLLMRLAYVLKYWRFSMGEREGAELLIFMTIISAYADFVDFNESWGASDYPAISVRYNILYKQIDNFYLNPAVGIFRDLKFSKTLGQDIALREYIERDRVHYVRECVYDEFLKGDNARAITGDKDPEIEPVLTCLDNIRFGALRLRFRKFVRGLADLAPCKMAMNAYSTGRNIVRTVGAIPGQIREFAQRSYESGCYVTDALLLKSFPSNSIAGRVRAGLMVITEPVLTAMGFKDMSVFSKILYGVAIVGGVAYQAVRGIYCSIYSLETRELRMLTKDGRLEFSAPALPAMLVRERNRNGTYDTIYKIHQLPRVNLIPDFNQAFGQYGGGIFDEPIDKPQMAADGTVTTFISLKELYDMLKQGYVVEELPHEMQDYVKAYLDANKEEGSRRRAFTDMTISPGKDYEQTVIAELPHVPNDMNKARFHVTEKVSHLILPETKTLVAALMNTQFAPVPSPANPGEGDDLLVEPTLSPLPIDPALAAQFGLATAQRRRRRSSKRRRRTMKKKRTTKKRRRTSGSKRH